MNDNTRDPDLEKTILEKKSEILQSSDIKILELILQQMEVTRQQHNYTKAEFGKILGLPDTSYSKLTKQQDRKGISVKTLVLYCRLFGLDLSTIVGRSYLDSADSVLRETAMFLARLNPETIDLIDTVIEESEESDSNKKQAKLLLTHLKTISDKPTPFYAADIPDAEVNGI